MRRELISAMTRLGAAYIDLYLLAIRQLASFRTRGEVERPEERLVDGFLDLLEQQAERPGFHAYRELASAATSFETLLAVNFPEVMERLDKFLRLIHRTRPDKASNDSRINVEEEVLRQAADTLGIRELLESAFPVREERLNGQLGAQDCRSG